jgi:hypothetical protein
MKAKKSLDKLRSLSLAPKLESLANKPGQAFDIDSPKLRVIELLMPSPATNPDPIPYILSDAGGHLPPHATPSLKRRRK